MQHLHNTNKILLKECAILHTAKFTGFKIMILHMIDDITYVIMILHLILYTT